jgi:uncharacterized protein YndB with AHSA1/START domain
MPLPAERHEQQREQVRREVEIEAPPEEVWEALATEAGRERWLEAEPGRELVVELADEPDRLVWWWWTDDAAPSRVELQVIAVGARTRVIVVESTPEFPLASLAASFSLALV